MDARVRALQRTRRAGHHRRGTTVGRPDPSTTAWLPARRERQRANELRCRQWHDLRPPWCEHRAGQRVRDRIAAAPAATVHLPVAPAGLCREQFRPSTPWPVTLRPARPGWGRSVGRWKPCERIPCCHPRRAGPNKGITIAALAAGSAPTLRAIDDWLQAAEEGIEKAILAGVLDSDANRLELCLTNPTDRALPDTELRLRIPSGTGVADPLDCRDYRALPARPRVATPALPKFAGIPRDLLTASTTPLLPDRQFWILETSDESDELEVVFSIGDLRPHGAVRLDVVCLAPTVPGQPLRCLLDRDEQPHRRSGTG